MKVAKAATEAELKQLKVSVFNMEKRIQDQTTRISNQVKKIDDFEQIVAKYEKRVE